MSQRSGRVAVVGGGLSGLMCAVKLKQLGLDAVVYDTGKHTVGGRCSSRAVEAGGRSYILDHSAQCFTAVSERFARVVGHWRAEGLVEEWPRDKVGTLRLDEQRQRQQPAAGAAGAAGAPAPGRFVPRGADAPPLFICPARGMRGLSEYLATLVTVQRPVWVGRLERRAPQDGGRGGGGCGGWDLYGPGGRHLGAFDYVVIAHNGKCADQLMSTASVPAVHNLLRVRFCPAPLPQQQVMQLCSLWVLMVGFPSPLPVAWQGAFVEGSAVLSWAANNTAKIAANRQPPKGGGAGGGPPLEFWTLISTREFGSQHKVPQENIPPGKAREVTELMLAAFAAAVGLAAPPRPSYTRVQLWGAAVPMNVLASSEEPCVLDAGSRVGICGDWLHSPSVEGACLSGLALAEAIQENWLGRTSRSIGLGPARFRVVATAGSGGGEAAPIGSFASGGGGGGGGSHPRQSPQQAQAQGQPPQSQPQPQPQPQPGRPLSAQQGWIRPPSGAGAAGPMRGVNAKPMVPVAAAAAPPPPSQSQPCGRQEPSRNNQRQQLQSEPQQREREQQQQPAAATGGAGGGTGGGDLEVQLAAARERAEQLTGPASRNARRRAAKRAQGLQQRLAQAGGSVGSGGEGA